MASVRDLILASASFVAMSIVFQILRSERAVGAPPLRAFLGIVKSLSHLGVGIFSDVILGAIGWLVYKVLGPGRIPGLGDVIEAYPSQASIAIGVLMYAAFRVIVGNTAVGKELATKFEIETSGSGSHRIKDESSLRGANRLLYQILSTRDRSYLYVQESVRIAAVSAGHWGPGGSGAALEKYLSDKEVARLPVDEPVFSCAYRIQQKARIWGQLSKHEEDVVQKLLKLRNQTTVNDAYFDRVKAFINLLEVHNERQALNGVAIELGIQPKH